MPYGTVNADVIGTSVAGSNLGAGNATSFKNRIINGAQVINQRGVTVTNPNPSYVTDRWNAVSYGSATVAQSSTAPIRKAPGVVAVGMFVGPEIISTLCPCFRSNAGKWDFHSPV